MGQPTNSTKSARPRHPMDWYGRRYRVTYDHEGWHINYTLMCNRHTGPADEIPDEPVIEIHTRTADDERLLAATIFDLADYFRRAGYDPKTPAEDEGADSS